MTSTIHRLAACKENLHQVTAIVEELYEADTPRHEVISMLQDAWRLRGDVFFDNRMSWLKLFTNRTPFYH